MRNTLASFLDRVPRAAARSALDAETRLLHGLRLARAPVAVEWITTRACDLRCPHCYSEAGPRAARELDADEACRLVVDELARMGCPQLVLAGGEALLRADLDAVVAHAAARGIAWSLQTHGGHVARRRALLERHPPAMVAVSVDGPEPLHDLFRGRAGSYADAMHGIATLKELGGSLVVAGTTLTRENADRLPEIFDVVRASGADAWGLHLFTPEGRGARHEELHPTLDQIRRALAFVRRKRLVFDVELGDDWGAAGADEALYRDRPFACGAGRFTCVVGASGDVFPCTTTDLAESEGNVRERALSALWAEGFARFRTEGHGACSDSGVCWLQARHGNDRAERVFCGGGGAYAEEAR